MTFAEFKETHRGGFHVANPTIADNDCMIVGRWLYQPLNGIYSIWLKAPEDYTIETTKMFADGIERKMTLSEFLKTKVHKESSVIVNSARYGEWIRGSGEYCLDHLNDQSLQTCVQDAVIAYDTIFVRVR